MEFAAFAILILFSLAGFIAIFFTTFGTFIILLGAAFFSWATSFSILSITSLLLLLLLYLFGEVLEYLFVILGAKKLGASNWAVAGAIVGGIIGAIAGTALMGVGVILGTFLGIFGGAFLVELCIKKDLKQSLKAGAGGVFGRVGSVIAKVFIAMAMFGIMGFQIFSHLTKGGVS